MINIYIINLYIFNYLVFTCAGFSKIGFPKIGFSNVGFPSIGFSIYGFSSCGCGTVMFIGGLGSMSAYTYNPGRYVTLLELKVAAPQQLFCSLLASEYKHTIPLEIKGYKRYIFIAHFIVRG